MRIPQGTELLPNKTPKRLVQPDLVFAEGNHFFVVEAKDLATKEKVGVREAEERAKAFEDLLKRNKKVNIRSYPGFRSSSSKRSTSSSFAAISSSSGLGIGSSDLIVH